MNDILEEYDLTDTQTKEIKALIAVLKQMDEFDEITMGELEELYKYPDISNNIKIYKIR